MIRNNSIDGTDLYQIVEYSLVACTTQQFELLYLYELGFFDGMEMIGNNRIHNDVVFILI
jgi:hypothetical protein